jgi:hypothetical protein
MITGDEFAIPRNDDAYKTFWYWINERHMIYIRRFEQGKPKPWTEDPVLQNYKFTNVFRELDRGTIWLRENFIEKYPHDSLMLFNIIWYRMFNLISTAESIGYVKDWDGIAVARQLDTKMASGLPVFTSAHMTKGGDAGTTKASYFCKILDGVWAQRHTMCLKIKQSGSIQAASEILDGIESIGGFLSYEIATDLRHTNILNHAVDIMTWANTGPGCMRGIRAIYPTADKADSLFVMRNLLHDSYRETANHVPKMEIRDIEHSLCEFSKYWKVKTGTGRPRVRFDGH